MATRSEWREVCLSEIADIVCGGTPDTSVRGYWIAEIEWVTAKDISECQEAKIHHTERRISRIGLAESSTKLLPALSTVLIARGATMGKSRLIAHPMALNQTCYGITARTGTDPVFLFYYLDSLRSYFRAIAHGSVFDTVIGSGLDSLKVRLPPLLEQQAIAHILGTLDDKIGLNRQMNETLEAIARVIFKSWFVDFDPIRAKAEGRNPPGMDAATAALFPDSFVDSPLGKIPKGWRVVALPDVVEINPRRPLAKGHIAPYLDMQNMASRGHRPAAWIDRPSGSGTKFVNGDTLLARITPCLEKGKTAFVDFLPEEGQVGWGSTEYIVFRPKPPLPAEYGYYLARSEDFRTYAIQNMTGSSGRQRVPPECFAQYRIAVPPVPIAQRFGESARTLMAMISANGVQSRTLAPLRDALLPKLLRGEIRVPALDDAYPSP